MTPTNMFFFGIVIWVTSIAVKYFIEDIIADITDDNDAKEN